MTDHNSNSASTGQPSTDETNISSGPGTPVFRAVLSPHRSLSQSGFLIVMIAVGLVSFFVGFAFLLMGAWPVMGFFGLDVALIYWAFKRNYYDGRAAETIEVTPHNVILTRINQMAVSKSLISILTGSGWRSMSVRTDART